MALSDQTKQELSTYLCTWLDKLIGKKAMTYKEEFKESDGKSKPFHSALLSDELTKMADFERSFSTIMGLEFEECAKIIAKDRFEIVKKQNKLVGKIKTHLNAEIDRIVTEINDGNIFENYQDEVKRVIEIARSHESELVDKSVISDLYVKDKEGNETFFEMKTPKPNKEQCLNITRRHLWIHCIRKEGFPKVKTYYGMAYNPYGESGEYRHSFSTKYLDMKNQVLIGKQFWNYLGGEGAYEDLLEVYLKVGKEKHDVIKKLFVTSE